MCTWVQVCVPGLCLPFCVPTLSHLPWKAPEGGGVVVAVLCPVCPVAVSRTVTPSPSQIPLHLAGIPGSGRALAPTPTTFVFSGLRSRRCHTHLWERDRPSNSSGMSLLVPHLASFTAPLSCPVTGSVEGRDVGNLESPGIVVISGGVRERTWLEDAVLQKILNSKSNTARKRIIVPICIYGPHPVSVSEPLEASARGSLTDGAASALWACVRQVASERRSRKT